MLLAGNFSWPEELRKISVYLCQRCDPVNSIGDLKYTALLQGE